MNGVIFRCKVMLGILFASLLCARLFFLTSFVYLSIDCLKFKVIIEQCRNRSFSAGDTGQALDIGGPFIESMSSGLYLVVLFNWSRFSTRTFFYILPRTYGFWFWLGMVLSFTVSVVSFFITQDKVLLGVSLVFEVLTASLLCCALKFVDRETVLFSLRQSNIMGSVLYHIYVASMWMYVFRHLTVFAYDTSTLIGQIKLPGKFASVTRLLICFNVATRFSFVQAFYSMMFKNPKIPKVCDNVETSMSYDLFGPIGVMDGSGGRQPLIRWETPIEEAMRHVQFETLK